MDNFQKWFDSYFIIDYSIPNILNVKTVNEYSNLSAKTFYIPPILYETDFNFSCKRSIDTLTTFINTNEPRRSSFLSKLKDHVNVSDCFDGQELKKLYEKTKVLLNIHQTEHHHTVEELRILPALLCGTIVICEDSPLKDSIPYKDFIVWSSFDNIIEKTNEILSNYEDFYLAFFNHERLKKLSELISNMKNESISTLTNLNLNLDAISRKYSLDKNIFTRCHHYIPGYSELFDPVRFSTKTLLEIGIGSVENGQMGGVLHLGYKTGNSLRCWRDYFPRANIFGIDLYQHFLNEKRISTYVADQSSSHDLERVIKNLKEIDIIIDDGSHVGSHQVFSFMFLEKYLSIDGIYVIEDVQPHNIEGFKDLSIFPTEFKEYLVRNYSIKYFDTRHVLNRSDDFMVSFRRN